MLAAVNFDYEPRFETDEIRNKASNGNLAAKFETLKPPIAQGVPQFALSVGHPRAQGTRGQNALALPLSLYGRGRPRAKRTAG